MFRKQYILKQSYVFARWSRNTWSLFSAIGKEIKIGAIASRLGDMAYKRLMIAGSFISTSYNINIKYDLRMQLLAISLFQTSFRPITIDCFNKISFYN